MKGNKARNNQLHTFNKPYRLMKQEERLTVDEYPPRENNGRMSVEASLGILYWGDEGKYDKGNKSVAAGNRFINYLLSFIYQKQ